MTCGSEIDVTAAEPDACVLTAKCDGRTNGDFFGRRHHQLVMVHRGCFRYRSQTQLLVDPITWLFGAALQPAEITHPIPGGDPYTMILLSDDAVAAIGRGDTTLPPAASATAWMQQAHRRLLTALRRRNDPMAVEEGALTLFGAAMAQQQPARVCRGRRATSQAHRRLLDDARALMAADPTLGSVLGLSRIVGCSPRHLSRVFVEQTGRGVAAYRTNLRLNLVLDGMPDAAMSLADLAAAAGFADQAHLSRAIKQRFGTTPTALRAKLTRSRNAP
jgi:AraC-like DNA-binding protein